MLSPCFAASILRSRADSLGRRTLIVWRVTAASSASGWSGTPKVYCGVATRPTVAVNVYVPPGTRKDPRGFEPLTL